MTLTALLDRKDWFLLHCKSLGKASLLWSWTLLSEEKGNNIGKIL